MPDPENELTHILTKLTADMGDLADSTNRLAHRSEDNTAIMNSVAELMRANTAALENFAVLIQSNTAAAERLVAALLERSKRRWLG
jgi:aspartate aminotransferase-like enzyme